MSDVAWIVMGLVAFLLAWSVMQVFVFCFMFQHFRNMTATMKIDLSEPKIENDQEFKNTELQTFAPLPIIRLMNDFNQTKQ